MLDTSGGPHKPPGEAVTRPPGLPAAPDGRGGKGRVKLRADWCIGASEWAILRTRPPEVGSPSLAADGTLVPEPNPL
jgi:hypothetical protein